MLFDKQSAKEQAPDTEEFGEAALAHPTAESDAAKPETEDFAAESEESAAEANVAEPGDGGKQWAEPHHSPDSLPQRLARYLGSMLRAGAEPQEPLIKSMVRFKYADGTTPGKLRTVRLAGVGVESSLFLDTLLTGYHFRGFAHRSYKTELISELAFVDSEYPSIASGAVVRFKYANGTTPDMPRTVRITELSDRLLTGYYFEGLEYRSYKLKSTSELAFVGVGDPVNDTGPVVRFTYAAGTGPGRPCTVQVTDVRYGRLSGYCFERRERRVYKTKLISELVFVDAEHLESGNSSDAEGSDPGRSESGSARRAESP